MFKGLHQIILGGEFAAIGILGMHYIGLHSQRTQVTMEIDIMLFILSVFIACTAASLAFWIIFRLLIIWQTKEWIRVISALIMALTVWITHFCVMVSTEYSYDPTMNVDTTGLISAELAGDIASHGSLMICYLLSAWGVYVKMDRSEKPKKPKAKRPFSKSAVAPLISEEASVAESKVAPASKSKVVPAAESKVVPVAKAKAIPVAKPKVVPKVVPAEKPRVNTMVFEDSSSGGSYESGDSSYEES